LGRARLRNRIVMESLPSNHTMLDGFVNQRLTTYYRARARGGAGMIVLEAARVTPQSHQSAHIGLYADVHIPALRGCLMAIKQEQCVAFVMLDQIWTSDDHLPTLAEAFIMAAWRAYAAGANGIMLSTADNGPFHRLNEPPLGEIRLTTLLYVIESIVAWLGRRCVIGLRLGIEEQMPGGLSLQDARVVARRLTSAGVSFIEVVMRVGRDMPLAQFPGWCVPVASALKSVVDVPVLVGGQIDDFELAEQSLREGSTDLVAIGERLQLDPRWPEHIQARLNKP
jgi:2,4-dienoyl-CoA reductase-like NADH-dependent reductase (Old Yellow Enzyme family)